MTCATQGWPGSTVPIKGVLPTYRLPYSKEDSDKERVDWILKFFDAEKPAARFYSLYFERVDSMGHREGPDSEKVGQELKKVDDIIGYLLEGLEKRDKRHLVDILIVSDHGMAPLSRDKVIHLDDYIPNLLSEIQLYDMSKESAFGSTCAIHPKDPENVIPLYEKLKNASDVINVYLKHEIPEKLHYQNNRRIPEILVTAKEGWFISFREFDRRLDYNGGHGWDPTIVTNMRGIFFANGPSFKKAHKVGGLKNVELYNLMCNILQIKPSPNNGTFENVKPILNQYEH